MGLPPAGAPDRDAHLPTLGDAEGVASPNPAPSGASLVTAVVTVIVAGFLVLGGGLGWWLLRRVPAEVVPVAPVGEAVAEAAAVLAEPPPVEPATLEPATEEPVAHPPLTTGVVAPRAPLPAPQDQEDLRRPTGVTASTPPSAEVQEGEEPAEEDAAPVRITASTPAVGASTAPSTAEPAQSSADPAAERPPEPDTPGPFRVSFAAGDASITSIDVRCLTRSGSGAEVVSVDAVDKGTTCKVTGNGGDAPLLAQVTVSADRSYTCFRGRARTCQ
jgi:hypothetical protein